MTNKVVSRYYGKINADNHVMTVEEFRESVEDGMFIDYDGFGYAARNGMSANDPIYPSEVDKIPEDATHIVWFNR